MQYLNFEMFDVIIFFNEFQIDAKIIFQVGLHFLDYSSLTTDGDLRNIQKMCFDVIEAAISI